MKFRIAALLAASLLLSGCSAFDSVSDIFGFPSDGDQSQYPAAGTASATVAAAPAGGPNAFCQAVAVHDATANDFDPATQQKMGQKSYSQCVALFGAN